ncbi:hypothetical protein BAUCODRAFT_386079 [Baudoinia panamericana UAMH 10762]|uniref:Uncharacterized protein n=1 Tax=Baudoinia panamericana (strain UAMH 10762) TaxID=717646 RepID=M2N4Q2_BAUPA|nr:uncharacterized protein BAUCODRAFT_386079 [Baudoinia panamericana UAMH 10762]EMC98958.1 hypothetical protein BAUCODRAFT_386079 [Baudoinia panamericana UAMH 10762]
MDESWFERCQIARLQKHILSQHLFAPKCMRSIPYGARKVTHNRLARHCMIACGLHTPSHFRFRSIWQDYVSGRLFQLSASIAYTELPISVKFVKRTTHCTARRKPM